MDYNDFYKIGKIGKPHGVKGEVSFMFDDDVFDRTDADWLMLSVDGILVPFFLEEYRFKSNETALVKFCDVDTQDEARELTGCDVFFPRHLADEDEGHLSWAQIVGYTLVDATTGRVVGDRERGRLDDEPPLPGAHSRRRRGARACSRRADKKHRHRRATDGA